MIKIYEGSLISKLLYILTVTGEFPMGSLSLLGSYRRNMQLIERAVQPCEYLNCKTKERYKTKLLTIVGEGRKKSLQFLTGAEIILSWLGLLELFEELHGEIHYRGDKRRRDRVHRMAEGYAMAYMAGLEINPMKMPHLQQEYIVDFFHSKKCYYGSKMLKKLESIEMNKNAYTRIIGAVFANQNAYAVYNTRNRIMKWSGKGEQKALVNMEEIARMNANIYRLRSAILFGKNAEVGLRTIEQTKKLKDYNCHFDSIYSHIHFIPLNDNGIRQLRIILLENWREQLLSALFPTSMRVYEEDTLEYDASVNGKYIISFFDGDIARLLRFQYVASRMKAEYEVLCFPFQVEIVKSCLGMLAKIKTVKMEVIENSMGIGGEK